MSSRTQLWTNEDGLVPRVAMEEALMQLLGVLQQLHDNGKLPKSAVQHPTRDEKVPRHQFPGLRKGSWGGRG
eukprot:gene13802-13923_t